MAKTRRQTATAVKDPGTGAWYLQGTESATAQRSNVFGNGNGVPLKSARDKTLFWEIEAVPGRVQVAADDPEDYGEFCRFWIYQWTLENGRASCRPFDEDGEHVCWIGKGPQDDPLLDKLIELAVGRLVSARDEKAMYGPCVVGGLRPQEKPGPRLSERACNEVEERVSELSARRAAHIPEKQLRVRKQTLAKRVINGIGLGDKAAVGAQTLAAAQEALLELARERKWSRPQIDRALLDLRQGFSYYRQSLRAKRLREDY